MRKLLDALVAAIPADASRSHRSRTTSIWVAVAPLEAILADVPFGHGRSAHIPRAHDGRPDRPVASPLARLQARTRDSVTTLLHTHVGIADVNALRLLPLVDGTRDRAALAAAVRQVAVNIDPSRAQDFVTYALEKFARLGLLMQ